MLRNSRRREMRAAAAVESASGGGGGMKTKQNEREHSEASVHSLCILLAAPEE